MINVGVLGATGYAGTELVRILLGHPDVNIKILVSHSYNGEKYAEVYKNYKQILNLECEELDIDKVAKECDVVFTALPHGASKSVIPELYAKGLKIIDLSGDFRYNDAGVYAEWYGEEHSAPELLNESVYGLCELHREEIKNTRLVGNPGCYTTCSILGLAPLLKHGLIEKKNIIIDAKSGVTGAGRSLKLQNHFCECNETMKAYGVATHRHTSEIEQELSLLASEDIVLSFTPHLVPFNRGILSTMYANLKKDTNLDELLEIYNQFYNDEYFVRICDKGELPEIKNVAGSNFVDIGLAVDKRLGRVIVVSCIDNLVKGAAGQAVQNMNILFSLDEKTGLAMPGYYI